MPFEDPPKQEDITAKFTNTTPKILHHLDERIADDDRKIADINAKAHGYFRRLFGLSKREQDRYNLAQRDRRNAEQEKKDVKEESEM